MERTICAVQLKNRKIANDLIQMLGLTKTISQLAVANRVR